MITVEAPWPQPMSATLAPASSLATTPSRAGSHSATRWRFVAGAEEAFGAAEHARMVIAPGQGAIAAHGVDQFVLVMEKRRDHADTARDINR